MKRILFAIALTFSVPLLGRAQTAIPTPEQFFGFQMGTDGKLARWDKIVDYMRQVSNASDRVRFRELGKSTNGNPFVALEISSPATLKNLDHYKQLERKLYFQGGAPSDADLDEIVRDGKVVIVITCSIHATEIGATQMAVDLVHRLATDDSPRVKKILDNVIFVLVPSLNPDGQMMVTDWFDKNVGTPFESSQIPWLYHPYVGHDNNRDMYMFTQKESRLTAKLLWADWFPAVWLDEHQMGSNAARIFVMPATDPINPNVHPLIYRWNGILGQSQAAALEAAGKEGIIYNSTYTNFWEGAMAWSGWWHNEVGLLTEVASVRVAAPTDQLRASPNRTGAGDAASTSGRGGAAGGGRGGRGESGAPDAPLAPPTDSQPRTEYPRPWMGGHWTLKDIVDYESIATMALLETVADRRETLLRQIYDVNKATVNSGWSDGYRVAIIPSNGQQDPREAAHVVEKLQMAGVSVGRANKAFEMEGKHYAEGTFIVPFNQVFGRYAKDMLERQTYPEVRRSPSSPPEPPYDVTAWSLGMLLGVNVDFSRSAAPEDLDLTVLTDTPKPTGEVTGTGAKFEFDYKGPDTAAAMNALLKNGAKVAFDGPSHVAVTGATRRQMESIAAEYGLSVRATDAAPRGAAPIPIHVPRIGMYQPFNGGNMDEGWTRWVLEQYGFQSSPLHNADIRAGHLRDRYDAIILADQSTRSIVDGVNGAGIRPEYRGGIGDDGVEALQDFVAHGGTLITLGAASDLAIERLGVPVKDLKQGLTRDQHFAPGTILNVEIDTANPLGYGVAPDTYGFYNNSPFFDVLDGFSSQKVSVIARYPNQDVVASGWLKGEDLMQGRPAVVSVDMNPGRIVLFGLRPQHRAQTHATFPLLFNALYMAAK
ncbi:MAG TPA: M14 metallopeptidase family protein [Vicinamibacterales bacterium]|nr:M14 metallopeptidase family protein [Vicinamibacterales bacterium]